MIHSVSWLVWVGAVLVTLSTTRNPLYLALVILWIVVISATIRPVSGTPPVPISPLRFAIVVMAMSALFNSLTVHFGSTILFRLPVFLPLIGGVITLEAVVYGLLNGLILSGIFAAFMVVNRALPVRAIIRLIPRSFYPVAVVISIAVTFVPVTLRQFQQIREAQAVRGHRLHGLRDWLPLFMPLLIGGLERALQLAEAMTARGFANSAGDAHNIKTRLLIITGLIALLGGWLLRLVWQRELAGISLILIGILLVLGALWIVGRAVTHTVYRPERWTGRDWGVVFGAVAVIMLFLLPIPGLDRQSIFYYPYPKLSMPGFNFLVGAATMGLLLPTLLTDRRR